MSDDFGTVSVKQKSREIEQLRQHYLRHRETIRGLAADAPTEHLANEYQRIAGDIDKALTKLAEIDGRSAASSSGPSTEFLRAKTQPGTIPLQTYDPDATQIDDGAAYVAADPNPRSRVALIVVAGLLVLALIGWMIWRGSNRGDAEAPPVVDTSATATDTSVDTAPLTTAPAVADDALAITPASADYGTMRKGTRAVRQFEIANNTEEPISIELARSACRCLFYDYAEVVPPRGKETITVTIDAARAPQGQLRETVKVSSKKDPAVAAAFDVSATVQ